jgi:hypothetical protein
MSRRQESDQSAERARAETQKEARDSVVMPQVGVLYPKEGAKGVLTAVPLFALLGAAAIFPFGFIEFGGMPLFGRLFVAGIIGAIAGGVIGLIVGPSVAMREKAKDQAGAPRGTAGRPGKAEMAEAMGESEPEASRDLRSDRRQSS